MQLQVASVLLFALGLAHSSLGERYILVRLFRRTDLPKLLGGTTFTTRTLHFAWHLTTVLAWGLAALLWQLAASCDPLARTLATTIGSTCAIAALLPLVLTRGRHLSWLVLLAVAALAFAWAHT